MVEKVTCNRMYQVSEYFHFFRAIMITIKKILFNMFITFIVVMKLTLVATITEQKIKKKIEFKRLSFKHILVFDSLLLFLFLKNIAMVFFQAKSTFNSYCVQVIDKTGDFTYHIISKLVLVSLRGYEFSYLQKQILYEKLLMNEKMYYFLCSMR